MVWLVVISSTRTLGLSRGSYKIEVFLFIVVIAILIAVIKQTMANFNPKPVTGVSLVLYQSDEGKSTINDAFK